MTTYIDKQRQLVTHRHTYQQIVANNNNTTTKSNKYQQITTKYSSQ